MRSVVRIIGDLILPVQVVHPSDSKPSHLVNDFAGAYEYLCYIADRIAGRLERTRLFNEGCRFQSSFVGLLSSDEDNCRSTLYAFTATLLEYVLPLANETTAQIIRQEIAACKAKNANLLGSFREQAKAQATIAIGLVSAAKRAEAQPWLSMPECDLPYDDRPHHSSRIIARVTTLYLVAEMAFEAAKGDLWMVMENACQIMEQAYIYQEPWAEDWTVRDAQEKSKSASREANLWMSEKLLELMQQ